MFPPILFNLCQAEAPAPFTLTLPEPESHFRAALETGFNNRRWRWGPADVSLGLFKLLKNDKLNVKFIVRFPHCYSMNASNSNLFQVKQLCKLLQWMFSWTHGNYSHLYFPKSGVGGKYEVRSETFLTNTCCYFLKLNCHTL